MRATRTLITGCSTGIGHAAATLLARRGHHVVATVRNAADGDDLAAAGCTVHPLDVTDRWAVAALVDTVGPVDALVNNAGVGYAGAIETMPHDLVEATLATNLLGPLELIRAVLPGMRARAAGVIVNVTSVNAHLANPFAGVYAATKFALRGLSEALAVEVAPFGIRVAVVEPGFFRSALAATARPPSLPADDSPYAPHDRTVLDHLTDGVEAGEDPAVAADAIRRAVEGDPPAFAIPVGADAARLIEARRRTPDDEWLDGMRRAYGIPASPAPSPT